MYRMSGHIMLESNITRFRFSIQFSISYYDAQDADNLICIHIYTREQF